MPTPTIDPDLAHRLANAAPHDLIDVNIFLTGEPAAALLEDATLDGDSAAVGDVIQAVQQAATAAQSDLMSFLTGGGVESAAADFTDDAVSVPAATDVESFWITNAIGTRVLASTLRQLLKRQDILFIDLSRRVDVAELLDAPPAAKKPTTPKKAAPRAKKARAEAAPDAGPTNAWSVDHINAPLCWKAGFDGKGVLVAMLDTGVNYKHPDLKKRMWKGGAAFPNHGFDFENNDNDPMDTQGHGTSTAGQVAGDGTSGTRTGVAPGATILAVRVGGVERNFWKGLQFALARKAHVISMSMTWKYPSNPDYPGWRRVCETILAAGVLHANSTGNQGAQLATHPIPFNVACPGNCPPPWMNPAQKPAAGRSSPISCGATDNADRLAAYSARGPAGWDLAAPYNDYPYVAGGAAPNGLIKPDVCAPGPGTTSCNYQFPDQPTAKPYSPFGGTSAATPHVGGCLAILAQACLKAKKPIVPARIQEALERTAKKVVGQAAAGAKENHYGAGRVDVYAAYLYGKGKKWW